MPHTLKTPVPAPSSVPTVQKPETSEETGGAFAEA